MMNLEILRKTILEDCRVDLLRPVVMGVSGGPDSLCLLDGLHQMGFHVIVAHFNHLLRAEAGEDAQRVADIAAKRGLPFELGSLDVGMVAREEKLSIEEVARMARYRFLFDCARRHAAQAVAVGHNADDQVETALMHLLRGTGLAGLKAMNFRVILAEWDPDIPLVRPLLATWRAEIDTYCQEHDLQPVQDASNFDTKFFRNRLRHDLLPVLQGYNPQVKQNIWRMTRVLSGDAEVVDAAVDEAWSKGLIERGAQDVVFNASKLERMSRGMQRRLLRKGIAKLQPGLRDIDFDMVERGIEFLHHPSRSRQIDLMQGVRLFLEGGQVYLAKEDALLLEEEWPQIGVGTEWVLEIPGALDLGRGWKIAADLGLMEPGYRTAGRWEAYLDADRLPERLAIRTMQTGERFQPLGLEGRSQKLSDFWVNGGVPRRARHGWPLIYSGNEVVWVPGFRLDHRYRITDSTKKVVHLAISHSA
jgi:tRNA(Ile)-lysidine synthase